MYEIFANHAHVFQQHVRKEGSLDNLKRLMEQCGLSRAVTFAPFGEWYDNQGENQNAWLAQQIKCDERFWGFGVINFARGDLGSQVREIKQLGLKGIKMHPAYQKFKIDGQNAFEVYAEAQRQNLMISFHSGVHWHRIADYHTLLFDEVAYNFKQLRFSLEHVGGYSFFKEAVAVMTNNGDNVYAGLTSVSDKGTNRLWYLSDSQLMDLFWLTGTDRSIFGLDFPYNQADKVKISIERIKNLDITEDDKVKILGGNLLKFLG